MDRETSLDEMIGPYFGIGAAAREARKNASLETILDGMVNPILPPKVAVGDCSAAGCDYMQPERWDMDYLDLYFDMDSQSVLTTAGNAPFTVTMNGTAQWFVPVAISITVNDATDMDLDRRVFLSALTVDGCRQWNINVTAPTMATTTLIPSDKFDPRARGGCACPLVMAPYTNVATGTANGVLAGINRNPVGINTMITVTLYGKEYNCCPKWYEDVRDPGKRPPNPTRPNGSASGTLTTGRPGLFGR